MLTRRLVVCALVALAAPGSSRAADFFLLDPNVARPGERVTVSSGTAGSDTVPVRFALYLVENSVAAEVASGDDERLHSIGTIAIGERGDGELTFAVPEVASGVYVVAYERIGPCPHSGICGPPFHSSPVTEQNTTARYRPLMTLRVVDGDGSSSGLGLPLALLGIGGAAALTTVALRRRARVRQAV